MKRNLFSKIVAGIGALAMVATMLPAIATTAEARTEAFTLHLVKDPTHAGGPTGRHYNWAYLGTDSSVLTTGVNPAAKADHDDAAPVNVLATEAGKDLYLLFWPDKYYEFNGRPTAPKLIDNTAGEAVWNTASNRCRITDNKNYPGSYIVTVPSGQLKGGENAADADVLTINMTDTQKEVVQIIVKTGEDVNAQIKSNPTGTIPSGGQVTYNLTINDSNDGVLVNGIAADTTMYNNDSAVPVNGIVSEVTTADVDYDNSTDVKTTNADAAASVIAIEAGKKSGSGGALTMTVNGQDYAKSELVQRYIEFAGPAGPTWDQMAYVQVTNPDAAATPALAAGKLDYSTANATSYRFGIWFTNIFNLYFDGLSDNANAARVALTAKQSKYKVTTIEIGTKARTGDVIFRNGEELAKGNAGLASMYTRSFVFRDKDGKRFDLTENATAAMNEAALSYSGDPEFYRMEDLTEGEELSFTLELDPMYKKTDDFGVWIVPVVDDVDDGGLADGVAEELKPDANGLYTVKLGGDFTYAIYADGITLKSGSDLREVINQPQADAVYAPTHPAVAPTPAGEGKYHTGLPTFPFYNNGMFATWAADSCNVAAPRYMIYLEASEEDTDLVKVFPFAAPRAVATTNNDYIGTSFPLGEYKFKIRFADSFVEDGHGSFDNSVINDRYAEGPDFKVTIDGVEATKGADGLYTLNITEGKEPIVIKVDGVVPAYRVLAPNVSAYDIEVAEGIEIQRETSDNFVSRIVAGEKYRFKINFDEGVSKGPNFKVELAQVNDPGSKGDYSTDVVRTQIPEGADGWYEFTVNNDTQIIISGIIGGEGFSDVGTRSDEEQAAITWLKDQGIKGFEDGTFRPSMSTTRAEFVRMLYVLNGGTAATASFSDTGSHWAASEIGWGAGKNIVNGYPDGTFKPDQPIRRAEVAQIIWKMNGNQASSFTASFPDVSQTAWYAPAVNWNFGQGIIKGYANGNFGPNDPIERAHIALMLYRSK